MNRIALKFSRLRESGKKALIPYLTPEFPRPGVTLPLLNGLAEAGVDLIEVGIPFSDPLADGKTIQYSSQVALENGVSLTIILRAIREFRSEQDLPVILMGYMNPILRYGVERFIQHASQAGVDGLIVPDLPPEEASELVGAAKQASVSNIFLIAPTTNEERIRMIDNYSTDFSYCVSVAGVTGQRTELGGNGGLDSFLLRVKNNVRKPFVVGFGISNPDHVRQVWRHADGAVVGSAMIDAMAGAKTKKEAVNAAVRFMNKLRPAS